MKKKLPLKELKVQSFITDQKNTGGAATGEIACFSNIEYTDCCPTQAPTCQIACFSNVEYTDCCQTRNVILC
ncbi:MAG: pinensin family lanthipeptide [Acidobacteriota bacterium]|nr:pinensin family lanthipeptide [Acidobacteriota bacterium]